MKKPSYALLGLLFICALSLLFAGISIFALDGVKQRTSSIYEHPYKVALTAHEIRSRLLDTRAFFKTFLAGGAQNSEELTSLLTERYKLQKQSIAFAARSYLGPSEDVQKLSEAMDKLFARQLEMVRYAGTHPLEDAAIFFKDNLTPAYYEMQSNLAELIDAADKKVKSLERESASIVHIGTFIAVSLALAIILGTVCFFLLFQKKSQRAIASREKLFDILSSNVDDVFFIYSVEEKRLEYLSPNAKRVLGLDEEAFRKDLLALYSILSDEDRDKLKKISENGQITEPIEQEFSLTDTVTGKQRYMHLHIFPVMVQGTPTRYVISISDRTPYIETQKVLEDALINAQNANAAKKDFLSRMSHEIRTPMNAIIGMTAIATSHIDDPARIGDCLYKIGLSSTHLMSLINDVLDMSKIEGGKLTISQEPFELRRLIDSVVSIVYPQTVAQGQTFEVHLADVEEEWLIGDVLRLNQILLNLLSNARKFTPKGGSIRVDIRQLSTRDGVRMRFTISDTGIGMSEEFLGRLFTPFEQADASISQKYGGTGLGMSITKNLTTLMGGTIHVKSKLGEGSSFAVELPFAIPEQSRSLERKRELDALDILVVDDDRDVCEYASLLLCRMGMTVSFALSGEEAVNRVIAAHDDGKDYDVCLIDWRMPGMDGIEVTRRIRQTVGPDVLLIIITAYDWTSIEASAREAGANGFISKPLFASSLYDTLLNVSGHDKPETNPASPVVDLTGHNVLLAEDNDLNREIAEELLKAQGLSVDCAKNGQVAVDMFRASVPGTYGAILMDIQMPVMDGYQATATIRALNRPDAAGIPIIAMTANAFSEDVSAASAAGMNGHIAKPIDTALLYQTLARYLCRERERERDQRETPLPGCSGSFWAAAPLRQSRKELRIRQGATASSVAFSLPAPCQIPPSNIPRGGRNMAIMQ